MSKAFTKESDEGPEESPLLSCQSPLPPGAKNYMTSGGARRLREKLEHLSQVVRPAAFQSAIPSASDHKAVDGVDIAEKKRKLQEIDRRIRLLGERLESAEVIDPSPQEADCIRFGAMVTVRNEGGVERAYRIVGIDETDAERGFVSWLSPIAKALLNSRAGATVKFQSPDGEEKLKIIRVEYGRD